ncbi:dTDP-4-amino-4,6-dideoxygalactose transaminase [Rhodoplanes sp. TEM]|uniref:dTDP-4-amino-4,6-dideoxygalactose transaminase n=1 Tax=Rhodoplanes tepidamans TaxID=200616 RepID=A0ABT5JD83_RHOTP|nr:MULTISPECIES: dTDP-4-amino-4,6-dideoxygalactose transaminase [Rhodoplanes]MDC7787413.1 dTDP-4-amino-4,6-dideoxygalactose transaminase [Rhodoplanes tepidamans]MDC7985532.1 dTDP-4-amino-4,6-dideoxygalactose transaminase [Rhodoplanes sp. TEM]MDQ0358101.1 dTDP-4-amino-4,6-dideoxygalactose transaminase [Rhodoplanes tepidamans]
MTSRIPFNRPTIVGRELANIVDAVTRGQLAGDGFYTRACETRLRDIVGGGSVFLTHSCTAALEMAAILLDLGPGDEVVMPSFTFVSTANAVALRGATPVFVDVDPQTLNIDPERVRTAVTARTKAIFAVHYAGVPAEMDTLQQIADAHRLPIVEDAAQALGSRYRGRPAGSLGRLAAFSFHETKNVISGEGGALVVNDPRLADRAAIIREKGTNRTQFFEGRVDKYTWVDIGSSFLPGELVAAYLYGQIELADAINARRRAVWHLYHEALEELERGALLRRPVVPAHCDHNGHMYYVLLPTPDARRSFIAAMAKQGIGTPFHYVPLHGSPAGRRLGRVSGPMRVTDDLAARLVRLPLFHSLSDDAARDVVSALRSSITGGRP